MRPFFGQITRDLDIAWQTRHDVGVMLGFFVLIIAFVLNFYYYTHDVSFNTSHEAYGE